MAYEFNQSVTLGVWVRRSGAWQKAAQVVAYSYNPNTTQGQKTMGWTFNQSIQLGTGIEAFGISLDSTDGTSATLDDINSISWTAGGAPSGERTALPNGATTTITVRPR